MHRFQLECLSNCLLHQNRCISFNWNVSSIVFHTRTDALNSTGKFAQSILAFYTNHTILYSSHTHFPLFLTLAACGVWWSRGKALGFRSRGPGFKTTCYHFETWAISFTPLCPCLLEDTLKAVGSFYLVSIPGEVKVPTQVNGKNLS